MVNWVHGKNSTRGGSLRSTKTWLLGPTLDLVFISNITWPVIAVLSFWINNAYFKTGLGLYAYFAITMPHRWLTLGLIFAEKDRVHQQRKTLFAVGLVTILLFFSLWGFAGIGT